MARLQMDDGTFVDTDNATKTWKEDTRWDGHNHISKATGSQWEHETLYKSRKGRYFVVHSSAYQHKADRAEWIGNHAAASWLIANGHELPTDLAELEAELVD